jgi:putative transposase
VSRGCRAGESIFHSLKVERLHGLRLTDREEICEELKDYIERFYNRQRHHSTLGHINPVLFELRNAA